MLNSICAPEMSWNGGGTYDGPHAYVNWKEGDADREIVPLPFVQRFPKTWRQAGWDKNYLFRTFWSPDEEETPSTMLKRVAEIPTYDSGTGRDRAGFHRATVIMVKETKAELLAHIDKKRLSISTMSYTSFEDPVKADRAKDSSGQAKADVAPVSKSKNKKPQAASKKKVSKGINLKATASNSSTLRDSLKRRYNMGSSSAEEDAFTENPIGGQSKPKKPNSTATPVSLKKSDSKVSKGAVLDSESKKSSSNSTPVNQKKSDPIIQEQSSHTRRGSKNAHNDSPPCSDEGNVSKAAALDPKLKDSSYTARTAGTKDGGSHTDRDSKNNAHKDSSPFSDEGNERSKVAVLDPESMKASSTATPMNQKKFDPNIQEQSSCDEMNEKSQQYSGDSSNADSDTSVKTISEGSHDELKGKSQQDDYNSCEESAKTSSSRKLLARTGRGSKNSYKDSSASSDEELKINGAALDPDFTPRKYMQIKDELQIEKKTVKRVLDLNLNLQSKLVQAEGEIKSLKGALSDTKSLKQKNSVLEGKIKALESQLQSKNQNPLGKTQYKQKLNSLDDLPSNSRFQLKNSKTQQNSDDKGNNYDSYIPQTPTSPPSPVNSLEGLCVQTLTEEIGSPNSDKADSNNLLQPLLTLGIEIPEQRQKAISSIPTGVKADNRFVKDLLLVAFGPEVLASSSKDGTARGGRKLVPGEERKRKPALDTKIVSAVRAIYLDRLKQEGVDIEEPENDERSCTKTFNNALAGAQRRCRTLGYGKGSKSNSLSDDLFSFNSTD